ncbi:RDD family protein [Ottowia sp.]|uniref:RDD family protein n=1 Tax=Ottowia sp. TaxID=1898956 RepID=UPI001D7BA964|nr:RDD family protein [Ottowia sp.]MCB1998695.1 RDD family protein [Rhodoferax sp.]MCP5257692.1 RDD family protein [Burkholderiaceae bacterium]MCB2024938.1 RDD family protein [Ottowia sp.]HPR44615.1 RDD family protein [Ottowia sp.]HRW73912.1 RDD family protein [Ottowia sp.]
MQEEWWYAIGDTRKGPVSLGTLRQLLLDRKVSEGTLVWREGREGWAPISEIPDFHEVVKAVPPELPKPTAREHLIALPLAGPWRRFFARLVDLWVIALPVSFVAAFALSKVSPAFGLWIQRPGSEYAFGWLILPFVLLVEAGIVALFGTTLGKALLGVKVTTIGAQSPTAAQYLQRQLGVYWYGLGTGFPFVSLFTMARQHGRIKAGRQAGYDEGKFNVKAPKLGVLRALSAIVVVLGLFFVNAAIQQISKSSERSYYSGTTWVNQVTGKSVAIPSGWIHEEQKNGDKQPIQLFSGPDYGVYVVFAKEDVPSNMELQDYLDAWVTAVRGNMRLSVPGQLVLVGGRQAITVTGTMADDRTQRVHATLVKKGRQVWRVVILSNSGKEPASEHPMKLQALLFQSIE